jgi:hypothetical protein
MAVIEGDVMLPPRRAVPEKSGGALDVLWATKVEEYTQDSKLRLLVGDFRNINPKGEY